MYDSVLLTRMHIIISKNPFLCWELADFYKQEQDGGHSNFISKYFIIYTLSTIDLFFLHRNRDCLKLGVFLYLYT